MSTKKNIVYINPDRLQWCCNQIGITISDLYSKVKVNEEKLAKAMNGEKSLTINQLKKLAIFFNRSLLFFLNPGPIKEEKIYSPQFRTINNQKPINCRKLRAFIENVENKRKIYLNLLEELKININSEWKTQLSLDNNNIKKSSSTVRAWLGLKENDTFEDIRNKVEKKGFMVIVSNGHGGRWKIEHETLVKGFSLYYDILPVIVVKKQSSKGAQTFTLMHELAHLLLDQDSFIDDEQSLSKYSGKEKNANEFSGNLLIPDNFLNKIDIKKLLQLDVSQYNNYLNQFKKKWSVSTEAVLVRLLRATKITNSLYDEYKKWQSNLPEKTLKKGGTRIRHKEPINIFGRAYVASVLDAKQNKYITLFKAITYLDNLKIHAYHKLEKEFV